MSIGLVLWGIGFANKAIPGNGIIPQGCQVLEFNVKFYLPLHFPFSLSLFLTFSPFLIFFLFLSSFCLIFFSFYLLNFFRLLLCFPFPVFYTFSFVPLPFFSFSYFSLSFSSIRVMIFFCFLTILWNQILHVHLSFIRAFVVRHIWHFWLTPLFLVNY